MTDDSPLRCYGCEHCTHEDRRDDGICISYCAACQGRAGRVAGLLPGGLEPP